MWLVLDHGPKHLIAKVKVYCMYGGAPKDKNIMIKTGNITEATSSR